MKILKIIGKIVSYVMALLFGLTLLTFTTIILLNRIFNEKSLYKIIDNMNVIENGIIELKENKIDNLYTDLNLKMSNTKFKKIIKNSQLQSATTTYITKMICEKLQLSYKEKSLFNNFDIKFELIKNIDEELNTEQIKKISAFVDEVVDSVEKLKMNKKDDKIIEYIVPKILKIKESKVIFNFLIIFLIELSLIILFNFKSSSKIIGTIISTIGVSLLFAYLVVLFILSSFFNGLTINNNVINAIGNRIAKLDLIVAIIYILIGLLIICISKIFFQNTKKRVLTVENT